MAELRKVKIASGAGETFGVDDIAIAWAHSGGFWEREGLQVEFTPARGGVKVANAVLSREVDAGYGTWIPVVKQATEGEPIRVLVSMALALAQNLVVNKTKIKTPQDLRGKKWAVDGIGALSHSLGLLICRGLGVDANEVEWVVAGPPPERKAHLLQGLADCALMRVEEALALERDNPELLAKLLGFDEIQPLAPVQPHGILSVRSDWAADRPEDCRALVRGLVLASRSLHDSCEDFRKAVRSHVHHVTVTDEDIDAIWKVEHAARSFAVNGGCSNSHWIDNLDTYRVLNEGKTALPFEDVSVPDVVEKVLEEIGVAPSHDPPPGTTTDVLGRMMERLVPCCVKRGRSG